MSTIVPTTADLDARHRDGSLLPAAALTGAALGRTRLSPVGGFHRIEPTPEQLRAMDATT